MSSYGSSAYGSLPVSETTAVTFSSTSSVSIISTGQFVTVDGPVSLFGLVDFEGKTVTRPVRRGLYPGEVFVYEEDYFFPVDLPGASTFIGPRAFLNLASDGNPASVVFGAADNVTMNVVERIVYPTADPSSVTFGTAQATLVAFDMQVSETSVTEYEAPEAGYGPMRVAASSNREAITEPVDRSNAGYDPLTVSASSNREAIAEPAVGTPLVISDPGDQSADEGTHYGPIVGTINYVILGSTGDAGSGGRGLTYNPDTEIAVAGDWLADSLHVYDVSNKTSPSQVGTLSGTNFNGAHAVALNRAANLVYVVAQNDNRLLVVDVSTPSAPSVTGSVQNATDLNNPRHVIYDSAKDVVYVACSVGDALTVVDVSTPSAPAVIGTVSNATDLNNPWKMALDAATDRVYVCCEDGNTLTAVDVSTSTAPSIIGTVGSVSGATDVSLDLDRDIAWVGGNSQSYAIDIANPASMSITRTTAVTGRARGVHYDPNNKAFHLALSGNELRCFDVTTPADPWPLFDSLINASQLDGPYDIVYDQFTGYLYVMTQDDRELTIVNVFG